MSIITALTCTNCEEFEPHCRCEKQSIPADSMTVTASPSAPSLTREEGMRLLERFRDSWRFDSREVHDRVAEECLKAMQVKQ